MILVTGGSCQGQDEFAKMLTDGTGITVTGGFHLLVKKWIDEGLDPETEFEKLIAGGRQAVFVTDEIGGGIIPMDESDRTWRELHGRLCCRLAAMSDEVYRVTCGIAVRIK